MYCNICCEKYKQDAIKCDFCEFEACNKCCETYILDQPTPKCMNMSCGKDWSRKFIKTKIGGSFMTDKFKKHMEDILYEREKALMPATQPLIENKIRLNKMKDDLQEIKKQIKNLEDIKRRLEFNIERVRTQREPIDFLGGENNTDVSVNPVKNNGNNYIRACPAENCRGFLNKNWTCGLCENKTCKNCHEILNNEEHVCDENNVKTAKLLEMDTKSCPTCSTKIFKIDGCDQMWCTQCHTAFSWKTGNIEKTIHNPHYYEWKRKNGGLEPVKNDMFAGGGGGLPQGNGECYEINNNTFDQLINYAKNNNHIDLYRETNNAGVNTLTVEKDFNTVIEMVQHIIHNRVVEMPKFRTDIYKNNEELRIKFMTNEINESQFKTLIQRNDKKIKKNEEIYNILQFFNTTINSIFYRILTNLKNTRNCNHNFIELFKEIEGLRDYCNNYFIDISDTYDSVLYNFDKKYRFITVKSEKEHKKFVEKLENIASRWLNSVTNRNIPGFNPEKPTACRQAVLDYVNGKSYIYDLPDWIYTDKRVGKTTKYTCDMTV